MLGHQCTRNRLSVDRRWNKRFHTTQMEDIKATWLKQGSGSKERLSEYRREPFHKIRNDNVKSTWLEPSNGSKEELTECRRETGGGRERWGKPVARKTFKTRATVLAAIVAKNRNLEKDLKAKTEELETAKRKLEQEQGNKQKYQQEIASLQASLQDAESKLQRASDSADKLRQENKRKSDQVEKMERNISQMEDRIRNLEIRASEVEKAELTLESTRRNLENSQHECRTREGEIARLQEKHDKTCHELDQANTTISQLEQKIVDLKHQVRHELMKNENIERGLETIPLLKDDIAERDKRISGLEKDAEDKAALLAAARKAVRDFKDRIRDLERGEAAGDSMRRELEHAQHEVTSLKQLMAGKDALLLRKSQALDQARLIIESLPRSQDEKEKMRKIQHILSKLAAIQNEQCEAHCTRTSSNQKSPLASANRVSQNGTQELTVDTAPYDRDSDCSLLERCLQENQAPPPPRAASSAHSPLIRRTPSLKHAQRNSPRPHGRSSHPRPLTSNVYRPETRPGSKFPPSLDYTLGDVHESGDSWSHVTASHPRPHSAGWGGAGSDSSLDTEEWGEGEEESVARLRLTGRQRDEVLSAALSVGDRVSFTVPQKPPRYGRKKPKPVVYTGIVKYIGKLDKEQYDARVHCGVRLDEPIGEKDGVYKGKRYMFTPQNHAKFFKVRDMTSVLDVKTGQYVTANHLLLRQMKRNPGFHREELLTGTA